MGKDFKFSKRSSLIGFIVGTILSVLSLFVPQVKDFKDALSQTNENPVSVVVDSIK